MLAGLLRRQAGRVVGPSGAVVAQDVLRDYLADLAKRVQRLKLTNVELAAIGYRELSFHTLTGDAGYLAIFEPRRTPSTVCLCTLSAIKRGSCTTTSPRGGAGHGGHRRRGR